MHIDSQHKATQMLRGELNTPIPGENLPCTNVWHLPKIDFQMPWWRKWRESCNYSELRFV